MSPTLDVTHTSFRLNEPPSLKTLPNTFPMASWLPYIWAVSMCLRTHTL